MNELIKYIVDYEGQRLELMGRPDVGSDQQVIAMIFINQMFSTERFPIHHKALSDYFAQLIAGSKVPAIIDAGANIGIASRYFAEKYPEATIYAIEPGNENFSILTLNMSGKNFVGLEGAVSSQSGQLFLNTKDFGPIGFRTGTCGDTQVRAHGLSELMSNIAATYSPFILKIDIEGAEHELFSADSTFLADIPLVIMEPHDWMIPFEGVSRNFYQQISRLDFDVLMSGENIFCFNNALLSKFNQ